MLTEKVAFERLRTGVSTPLIKDMIAFALERISDIIEPDHDNPPPMLFPFPETLRVTMEDRQQFKHIETEMDRVTFILTTHPERGVPLICKGEMESLLRQRSVLEEWSGIAQNIQRLGKAELVNAAQKQHRSDPCGDYSKLTFIAMPSDYEAVGCPEMSLDLWTRSLCEMASQVAEKELSNTLQFLQIHAFLRDPICGLSKSFDNQVALFSLLLSSVQTLIQKNTLDTEKLQRVVAQAAQESSYLSSPLLEYLTYIHVHDRHQLPYANIPLDSLSRAEFSVPSHVLEVVEEMISMVSAHGGHVCAIVPLLVASCPAFSSKQKDLFFLIDGNHRATASMFLRFLAKQPLVPDCKLMSRYLFEYCKAHSLCKKWQIDLLDVLDQLYKNNNNNIYNLITSSQELVRKFAVISTIPALVVQEENFLTVCKQRSVGKSRPVLLHPFHQTLFNDENLLLALPGKAGQTHGRPEVFKLLPLLPFGTKECESVEADTFEIHSTTLRKSMMGLEV